MTGDSLTRGQYLHLDRAGFLIFVLVFVSRDFEFGRISLAGGVDRQSRTAKNVLSYHGISTLKVKISNACCNCFFHCLFYERFALLCRLSSNQRGMLVTSCTCISSSSSSSVPSSPSTCLSASSSTTSICRRKGLAPSSVNTT